MHFNPLLVVVFDPGYSFPQIGSGRAVGLLVSRPEDCVPGLEEKANFFIHPGFLVRESFHCFMCSHSLCTRVEVIHDRFGYCVNVGMGVLGGVSKKRIQSVCFKQKA